MINSASRDRICELLGGVVVSIEHIDSTSVPGLAAKPVIDIGLVVPDSADESSYVPHLESAGYRLIIREPNWHEHRCFKGPDTNLNLHVFSRALQRRRVISPSAIGFGSTRRTAGSTPVRSPLCSTPDSTTSGPTPMPRTRSSTRSTSAPLLIGR